MKRMIIIIVIAVMLGMTSVVDAGGFHHHRHRYGHANFGEAVEGMLILGTGLVFIKALDRAVNPPPQPQVVYVTPVSMSTCGTVYQCEYEREKARIQEQKQREYENTQRQRAINDARRHYQ